MMNIVKSFYLSFNRQVLEQDNQFHFIASVISGIRLSTGEPLLETEYFKTAIENMGSKPFPDVGMPKPCGEYLVSGNFFSPGNREVGAAEIKVKVGELEKTLMVFGPRRWEGGLPSKPEPITRMPIEYSLAYGGSGLDTNDQGIGFQEQVLPNIENPDRLVTSPNVKVEPAGLAVLDPSCSQRRRYLGTYDDNYLKQYFPGYPPDFDWQFFLAAASDQRIEGYYQGNENFEFHHMHPDHAEIKGRLPGFISRCFIKHGVADEHQQFTELKLNIDTLWFFPEADLALLISRGGMQVRDDEAEQISDVLLAFERPGDPSKDIDYYQAALDRRLNSDDVFLNNFNTPDLIPVGIKTAMQIFQEDALAETGKSAFEENLNAKIEATKAFVNEKTDELQVQQKNGLENIAAEFKKDVADLEQLFKKPAEQVKDPDVEALNKKLEAILPGITSGDAKKVDLTKFSFDKIGQIMAEVKALTDKKTAQAVDQVEQAKGQLQQEVDKGIKQAGSVGGVDAAVEDDKISRMIDDMGNKKTVLEGPIPRVDAKKITDQFSEFKPEMSEAMLSLQAMKAAGIENETTESLEKLINDSLKDQGEEHAESLKMAETAFRATYFMAAHYMQKGTSPHQESLVQVAEKFKIRVSQRQSVADRDWACIDLSGQLLDNIDFSNCYLEQVDFTGASLKNANFSGAILARAVFNGADVSGANFESANVGNVIAHGTNFTDANFKSAKISKSDFTGANLTGCVIEQVESLELVLNRADFTSAQLAKLRIIDADINGVNFSHANLTEAVFLQSSFKNTDFQEATMPGCVWADVLLENINFDKADLTKNCFVGTEPDKTRLTRVSFAAACLDKVNLQGISMVGSNLSYASMHSAIFNEADLSNSNLSHAEARQAQFRKARLDNCDMTSFNLMEGSLAKAHLAGATFQSANLYSVDFLRSYTGKTDFSIANLDNTLLKDWAPS